jgi:hypothetical protein
MLKKAKTTKRKSKGKRHLVHAESLDRLAGEFDALGAGAISGIALAKSLRDEASRVRGILR